VKEAETKEQNKRIIGALRADAPKWKSEHIKFVLGDRKSVVESDFCTKLKKLDVQEGSKNKPRLFADHLSQICEAHNRVIMSFLQQVQRFASQPQKDLGRTLGTIFTCNEM